MDVQTQDTTSTPAPAEPSPVGPVQAGYVHRSRPVRAVLVVVGTVSLAIGVIGIVVPVLPTTPFLLLAAACYARASTRLYGWLLGQRAVGAIIASWRESGTVTRGVKLRALAVVVITFAISIILVDTPIIRLGLAVIGTIVAVFLARIPTTEPGAPPGTMGAADD